MVLVCKTTRDVVDRLGLDFQGFVCIDKLALCTR